jgi:cytochrome P460
MNAARLSVALLLCACSGSFEGGQCTLPVLSDKLDSSAVLIVDGTLKSIGSTYAGWYRVDEWSHWAPELCRLQVSKPRISASDDADTHGGKLYFLYAKDRAAYMASATKEQPVGQVIVKESWTPVEVGEINEPPGTTPAVGHDFAERGGKFWKPGEKHGLFVMMKLAPETNGTDAGWVYATTNADGTAVHEVGRLASCMACHDKGTHDRMFGLKK